MTEDERCCAEFQSTFNEYGFCQATEAIYDVDEATQKLEALSLKLGKVEKATSGNSNNDMLKKFMDTIGPFSFKMVKRHAASYSKMGLEPHFEVGNTGGTYEFRKHDLDKVTGDPIVRIVNVLTAKTEASLSQVLLKASKGSGGVSERVEVLKFANFLNRCLALDPARRVSVRQALQHDFFMKKKKKEENTT